MNLVTALMVDNALSQSARDKEAESAWEAASRKKALPKLKAMFIPELDEDGSGNLELEEILNAPEELREQLQQIAKMEDCEELFHTLDFDNSGSIDVEEFCDGVLKASQDNKPMELLRLARQCNGIHDNAKAILQLLKEHLGNKVESDHCGNGSNSPSTLPAAEDRMGKRVSQPLGPCPSDLTILPRRTRLRSGCSRPPRRLSASR
ncbi:unnamed protein product [Prorocentrum cordatum]|uniref:EF-hand domain-containing protein n=1 Tax=Prorocentrum cordatum TaxID=2364126 RepID=A0ABN9UK72_9DINO|nr:unnamed protein product [Polarella glacialis]